MKDGKPQSDRDEIARGLRSILSDDTWADRDYRRAFCRCVLGNFRSGLVGVPRKLGSTWYPNRAAWRRERRTA